MHDSEGFLTAELGDEITGVWTLEEALARPGSLTDEVACGGWFCRFYSRLSPADVHFLETTLELSVGEDGDAALLAVTLDFRPQIGLFLFALDDGFYEIILMPWKGATVGAEAITLAAADVLFGTVAAIGWSPQVELRRFVDEF